MQESLSSFWEGGYGDGISDARCIFLKIPICLCPSHFLSASEFQHADTCMRSLVVLVMPWAHGHQMDVKSSLAWFVLVA